MAIYTVHRRAVAADDPVFVKDGFSWPAFIFTLFWLVYKRMWIVAAIVAAAMIATSQLAEMSGNAELTRTLTGLIIGLILGFEGNDLLRWSLARRGYGEIDVVQGSDLEEAELKHVMDGDGTDPTVPEAVSAAKHDPLTVDALGLFVAPGGRP
jgi:hypothetical protein